MATKFNKKASFSEALVPKEKVTITMEQKEHRYCCNVIYMSFVCIVGLLFFSVYIMYQNWLNSEVLQRIGGTAAVSNIEEINKSDDDHRFDGIKKEIQNINSTLSQVLEKSNQASSNIDDKAKKVINLYHIAMIGQSITQKLAVGSSINDELEELKKFDTSKVTNEINTLNAFEANRIAPNTIQSEIIKVMTAENAPKEVTNKGIWESFKDYFSSLFKIQRKNTAAVLTNKEIHEYLALSMELMNQGEVAAARILISSKLHNDKMVENIEELLKNYLTAQSAAQNIIKKSLYND